MSNNDNSGWTSSDDWDSSQNGGSFEPDGRGDEFSETTHRSWLQRLGDSIKGVLFGLLLIAGSSYLLFWNEGRAVTTANALNEGAGIVVSVPNTKVDPANAGKLVHVSGATSANSAIADPDFGIEARGLRLQRKVEMYQWKEERRSEKRQKLGGGEETVTRYIYSREWSDRPVNSSNFRNPSGHSNPSMPSVASRAFTPADARLGAFSIDERIISRLGAGETFEAPQSVAARARQRLGDRAQVIQGGIYAGNDPASPRVGDVRVTYTLLPLQEISAIARQTDSNLTPYVTSNKREILLAERGVQDPSIMFKHAQDQNSLITWLLRGVGVMLMFAGFSLVMAPISTFASVVPIFGDIAGFGTSLIAMLCTAIIAPLIMAIAWLFYRPLFSVAILAVGAIAVLLIRHLGKQRAAQRAALPPAAAGAGAPVRGGGTFLPPGFGKRK